MAAKKSKTLASLMTAQDDDGLFEDHEESMPIMEWGLIPSRKRQPLNLCQAFAKCSHQESCHCAPLMTAPAVENSFAALTERDDDEDDDDETTMLHQLTRFANKVHVGPKTSQKAAKKKNAALSHAKVAAIAQAVKSGEIGLPEINLSTNAEYEECWCLVDTGAGMSSANRKKHFPGAALIPRGPNEDPITLSTASGQVLEVNGTFTVPGFTKERQRFDTRFTDADVDMPILAGSEIASGGKNGREIVITQTGGLIRDLDTLEQSQVVKRRGVYFIKLKIPKQFTEGASSTGFGRQGNP